MTDIRASQIAAKTAGGAVHVVEIRDQEGAKYGVAYESKAPGRWLSRHRFQNVEQADAGALTLADFLGIEVR